MTEAATVQPTYQVPGPDEPWVLIEDVGELLGNEAYNKFQELGWPTEGVVVRPVDRPDEVGILYMRNYYPASLPHDHTGEPAWDTSDRAIRGDSLNGVAMWLTGYQRRAIPPYPWPQPVFGQPGDTPETVTARIEQIKQGIAALEGDTEREMRLFVEQVAEAMRVRADDDGMCSTFERIVDEFSERYPQFAMEGRGPTEETITVRVTVPYTVTLSGTAERMFDVTYSPQADDLDERIGEMVSEFRYDRDEDTEDVDEVDFDYDNYEYEEV
jgi:hypothetical protein